MHRSDIVLPVYVLRFTFYVFYAFTFYAFTLLDLVLRPLLRFYAFYAFAVLRFTPFHTVLPLLLFYANQLGVPPVWRRG